MTEAKSPLAPRRVRRSLRERFVEPPRLSLNALLASAPLDGVDLERSREPGRNVDL